MDSGQLKTERVLLEAARWSPEDALASYAREWPDLARALVGGRDIGDGSSFRRDFFVYIDEFLRSQVTGDELANTCRAMRAVLDHSSANQFKLAMAADARTATQERLAAGELNSIWGVTPIVGLGPMRTAGRMLGITADSFCYQPYLISSNFDIVLAKQYEWALKHEAIAYSWLAFSWAMLRYDIFHTYYDRGFLLPFGGYGSPNFGVSLEEMQLMRVAGKRLYCLAYGADNRTRARTLASGPINFCMHCTAPGRYCLCDDEKAEKMFSVIDQYTTANLASGLSTDYVPNSYEFHYLVVDTHEFEATPVETDASVPLRILHAPNHAQFKGSHYLMDTIADLRREGVPIELRLITGVPQTEVVAAMREAHVVADQFIGGFYGQTAIEAMALGRPVLCYVRDPQKAAAPKELPIINCSPDNIREVLLYLVAKRKSLATIGARSRKYVEKHHSLLAMAHRLKVLYEKTGDLPDTVLLHEPGPPLAKPFVLKRLNQTMSDAMLEARAGMRASLATLAAETVEHARHTRTDQETGRRSAAEQLRVIQAALTEARQRAEAAELGHEQSECALTEEQKARATAELNLLAATQVAFGAETRAADAERNAEFMAARDIKRIAEEALGAVRAAQLQAERAVRDAESETQSAREMAAKEVQAAQEARAELRWQETSLREAAQRAQQLEAAMQAAEAVAREKEVVAEQAAQSAHEAEARAAEREQAASAREEAARQAEIQAISAGTNLQESEAYLRLEAFAARNEAQITGQTLESAQAALRAASSSESAARMWRHQAEARELELAQASAAALQVLAQANAEIADLKGRAGRVGTHLRGMQASKAWKITAPLRALREAIRSRPERSTVTEAARSQDERQGRAMVATFEETHKRPLRVLHIGNPANEAYRNAKTQREWGIDADVLALDQYGGMDSPEWEDARQLQRPTNLARPDWGAMDLHGFRRPKWFVQGPVDPSIRYLLNKTANPAAAERHWRWLNFERWMQNSRSLQAKVARRLLFWRTRWMVGHSDVSTNAIVLQYAGQMMTKWSRRLRWLPLLPKRLARAGERAIQEGLIAEQSLTAPAPEGARPGWTHPYFAHLLERYDVVEAYGAYAAIPYLAGKPYIAHEHGPIASAIASQSAEGQLSAQAYGAAPAVFVTRTPSIATETLGVGRERTVALPPAVDTKRLLAFARRTQQNGPGRLARFFTSTHQNWVDAGSAEAKGNDRIIRALSFVRASGRVCVLHAIAWGNDVEASKALAQSLGVADMIAWRGVMPKSELWREYIDCDAVLDQFVTPTIGGAAAEAMTLGRRVVTRVDSQAAAEFFGASPPVYAAESAEDVARAMMRVIDDPSDLAGDGAANRAWALAYHSAARIASLQVKTYARLGVLTSPPGGPGGPAKRPALFGRLKTRTRNVLRRGLVKVVVATGSPALRLAIPLGRALTSWRMKHGNLRSLWGVTPILTLPLLARCDALLGLRSRSLVYVTYYISKNFDINLSRWNGFFMQHGAYHAFTNWVLAYALIRYDVFSFFCDRGILGPPNGRIWLAPDELKTLKAAGKRIYTYAYGADVRTRETTLALGTYNYCIDCTTPRKFCICSEEEGQRNVEGIKSYANAMVAMGDMIHYVPGSRNFHYWPVDIDCFPYSGTDWKGQRTLKILHAPNHQHFKGSRHLFAAMDRLKAEGAPIELKTISGVSNAEVLKAMVEADIVAEQFIGGAVGYTAVEGWSMGKPVLTYVRDVSATATWETGKWEDFPGLSMTPDHIYDMLKAILDGRYDLPEIGRASRRYAEAHYSLEAVALKLGSLYLETGDVSPRQQRIIGRNMQKLRDQLSARLAAPLPVFAS